MSAARRMIDTHQHVFWLGRDDKGLVADMTERSHFRREDGTYTNY
jgi:hypothetical protein